MRSGLWMSGSGGSGILVARKADGTWSPPAGILLHTAAMAFVIGVDIYDCVLVINSVSALEMFTRPRVVLGTDVGLTVGPLVPTGLLENDVKWKELNGTVLTYLKARGKHQDVQLDGSLVTERGNENERFYPGNSDVLNILAGNITKSIPETRPLFEVIKAAEGRTDYDAALMTFLSQQPAPSDAIIETPRGSPLTPLRTPFGLPNADDPDPFGVLALEMAGLEIREAGTRLRPQSSQFDYNPAPTSPVFSKFSRQSTDTYVSRSNRESFMSSKTQATAVTDACTQTDGVNTPETNLSHGNSDDGQDRAPEKLPTVMEPDEVDYTKIDSSPIRHLSPRDSILLDTPVNGSAAQTTEPAVAVVDEVKAKDDVAEDEFDAYPEDERDADADDEDEDDDDDDDEAIVYEVATAAAPTRTAIVATQVTQVIHAKGALVTIPKRVPPPLPARSPARASRASKSEYGDVSSLKSPLRTSFQSADLASDRAPTPAIDEAVAAVIAEAAPPAEVDAATIPLPDSTTESSKVERAEFEQHLTEASSVYANDEERWDTASNNPPPTPKTGETASSSAEESEQEPKTPRAEPDAQSRSGRLDTLNKEDDIEIMSHSGHSNPITVA